MIVATIGHHTLVIETLKDAEQLLDIFSRATLVDKTYDIDYRYYYALEPNKPRIALEIVEHCTIHTFEERLAMDAERQRRQEAAAKAAKATESAQ